MKSAPVTDPGPDLFETDIKDSVLMTVTSLVFIVGAASWIKFTKIRTLKNYVFLNIMLANILSYITLSFDAYGYLKFIKVSGATLTSLRIIYDTTISYFTLVIQFWLLVLCYVFYVDIVKVFNADFTRRYLKSSLFAWGVPLLVTFVFSVVLPIVLLSIKKYLLKDTFAKIFKVFFYISLSLYFIPLTINLFIYIKVLVTLFKTRNLSKTAVNSHRLYIASLIFLLSGTLSLTVPIFIVLEVSALTIVESSQLVVLDVYFLLVKSNRFIWKEYFFKSF